MQRAKKVEHPQKMRESGIELLKILAMVLIAVSHVVQTLRSANPYIAYQDYVIDLTIASTNSSYFVLALFNHLGALGNTIFFVCSAWFLLRSSTFSKRKWLLVLVETWVVSIIILAATLILRSGDIERKLILKSIFPTTYSNNWYITCYLLFYPIHPYLNTVIKRLSKQGLFRLTATMFVLYCCINSVMGGLFYSSDIVLWITIYFIVAYIQLHMPQFSDNLRQNICLLCVGVFGAVGLVFLTNCLGLRISFLNDWVLHWASNHNPFLIMISFVLVNIMRRCKFKNRHVNYFAGLTLLVYIIHENLILRTYYRPQMLNYVYTHHGYEHIVGWVLILAAIVFLFGLVGAICFDKLLSKPIRKFCDWLYLVCRRAYLRIEKLLMKVQ